MPADDDSDAGQRYRDRFEIQPVRSGLSHGFIPRPSSSLALGEPFTPDAPPKKKKKRTRANRPLDPPRADSRKPIPAGSKCHWCRVIFEDEGIGWTKEHLIPRSDPRSKGLRNNVVRACFECNSSRSNIPVEEWQPCVVAVMKRGASWPHVGRLARREWRRRYRSGTTASAAFQEVIRRNSRGYPDP